MNDKMSRFFGGVLIVAGLIVLATSHSWLGLRGIAYAGYGIYMIGRTLKGVRK